MQSMSLLDSTQLCCEITAEQAARCKPISTFVPFRHIGASLRSWSAYSSRNKAASSLKLALLVEHRLPLCSGPSAATCQVSPRGTQMKLASGRCLPIGSRSNTSAIWLPLRSSQPLYWLRLAKPESRDSPRRRFQIGSGARRRSC